jgi:hypothetical protein
MSENENTHSTEYFRGKENQTLFRMMSANGSKYARTDIRKESFAIRVVETWNRLPDSVKLTER